MRSEVVKSAFRPVGKCCLKRNEEPSIANNSDRNLAATRVITEEIGEVLPAGDLNITQLDNNVVQLNSCTDRRRPRFYDRDSEPLSDRQPECTCKRSSDVDSSDAEEAGWMAFSVHPTGPGPIKLWTEPFLLPGEPYSSPADTTS